MTVTAINVPFINVCIHLFNDPTSNWSNVAFDERGHGDEQGMLVAENY